MTNVSTLQSLIGGRWLGGATGPALGARFHGSNRRGWRRWSTRVVVTACEPGRKDALVILTAGFKFHGCEGRTAVRRCPACLTRALTECTRRDHRRD